MRFALIVTLGSCCAFAQDIRGRLLGTVADPSAAVIAGARVTVVNTGTNVAIAAQSNSDGNFVVVLDPGVYNVTVEATGFQA